jgi:hypothetical protein
MPVSVELAGSELSEKKKQTEFRMEYEQVYPLSTSSLSVI